MAAAGVLYFFDTSALAKRYLWDQGQFQFVTADKQLLGAATHAGLITVRPEDQVVPNHD